MRFAIRRRSVSSWVSPGPRKPMPPFCRSRWVQPRTRRVARCESCASSTCSLPSKLRARWAKMSKIKPLRSNTRRPVSFSRLRSWLGVRVWSTSTTSASFSSAQARISSALPDPTKYLGSGRAREASTSPTQTVPADAASAAKFSGVVRIDRMADADADQNGALTASRAFKQLQRTAPPLAPASPYRQARHGQHRPAMIHSTMAGSVTSPSSPVGSRTLRAGTTVEMACL